MANVNLIGKFYNPCDNSYCINRKGKQVYLAPWFGDNKYNPTRHELNARFEIVSNPYKEMITSRYSGTKTCTFIKVKSNITGEIYRVLYFEKCVINSYKDYVKRFNSNNLRFDEKSFNFL